MVSEAMFPRAAVREVEQTCTRIRPFPSCRIVHFIVFLTPLRKKEPPEAAALLRYITVRSALRPVLQPYPR